ncbi:MAG: 50S ribosomal protein L35 [Candidatus Magasanikbacteria bacterium]|nr:50S ribosomal protein L35 [Candidatus Magasanikbacteria bacterium]
MGKLKTRKSIAKRFRVTRNKKVVHRAAGQGHFNARESGNTTRGKRVDKTMAKTHVKMIVRALSNLI